MTDQPDPRARAAIIDELIGNAWPALDVHVLDGWILRLSARMSLRANSVLPAHTLGTLTLEERVRLVEEVYAARGLPACYQISPAADPADLDAELEGRGYEMRNAHNVMTAPIDGLHVRGTSDGEIRLITAPDSRWMEVSSEVWAWSPEWSAEVGEAMGRIWLPGVWATYLRDEEPIAVGRAVLDRGWLGVYGMATAPSARGQGAATAIIGRLVSWGEAHGAAQTYLMVGVDNPAQSLYERLGYRLAHTYHYRWTPSGPA